MNNYCIVAVLLYISSSGNSSSSSNVDGGGGYLNASKPPNLLGIRSTQSSSRKSQRFRLEHNRRL